MGGETVDHAPMGPSRRVAYAVLNTSSAPVWLAMVVAPHSKLTRWLVNRATILLIALGFSYDVLLATGVLRSGKPIDFRDPDAVRAALSNSDLFLAGWTHYIAFDLFVGRWIWEDALRGQRQARTALLLTWFAGPAGLSLYLLQRNRA